MWFAGGAWLVACGTESGGLSSGAQIPAEAGSSSASGGAGGTSPDAALAPDAASTTVTTYDAPLGALANEGLPGFCEPEACVKRVDGKDQFWIRDEVANYTGARRRAFYVDYGYVGEALDYDPIVRASSETGTTGGPNSSPAATIRNDWVPGMGRPSGSPRLRAQRLRGHGATTQTAPAAIRASTCTVSDTANSVSIR